jgi:hypothetical protein
MANVVLRPDRFAMVDYDPVRIKAIAESLADAAGLGADTEVVIEVQDASPLLRTSIDGMDPIHLSLESGALEDPKRPRQLNEPGAAGAIGRLLLRAADRLTEGFADAPADADLPLASGTAWEVHAAGRLARHGHQAQIQRWRYHFRNRHGFSDESDAVFDELWSADQLSWARIEALSARAQAAVAPT